VSHPRLLPVLGRLAALAWPIVIARSTQVAMGLTDALLVGHLGKEALAATTGGAMNALALLALPLGVASIVSAFSAQLHGAGEGGAARRFGFYGLGLALATELVALALLPAIPRALGHFDLSPEVRGLMAAYLRVRLASSGAAVGLDALAGFYAGAGNTRIPMLASLAALALNVAGNWLLIDGRLGLPAMGVTGSALASALATTGAFAGLLCVFLGGRARAAAAPVTALSARELGRMLRVGLPLGVTGALEQLAFAFLVDVVVAGFGTTTLAASMAVLQVSSLASLPAFAFATSGAILSGQAIGRGARDDVPRLTRTTLAAVAGWHAIVALAYAILARPIMAPFVSDAPGARGFIEAGAPLLLLSAAWTLFEAMAATYVESLSAAGDTAVTLWARAAVIAGVLAPGAWALVHELSCGATGVVLWFIGCAALLVGVLHARFQGGAWRRTQLTSPDLRGLCHAAS
jgi:MATE family multidrug resistance protein